jgi:hypothetical protein
MRPKRPIQLAVNAPKEFALVEMAQEKDQTQEAQADAQNAGSIESVWVKNVTVDGAHLCPDSITSRLHRRLPQSVPSQE